MDVLFFVRVQVVKEVITFVDYVIKAVSLLQPITSEYAQNGFKTPSISEFFSESWTWTSTADSIIEISSLSLSSKVSY